MIDPFAFPHKGLFLCIGGGVICLGILICGILESR